MTKIDPAVAQRVWQRVQGKTEAGPSLGTLCYREGVLAEDSLRLAKVLPSRAEALKQTAKAAYAREKCLRGMAGDGKKRVLPPHKPENVDKVLHRCCNGCMRAAEDYENRSKDPQYGPLYAQMAREHLSHCRLFLEIVGELGKI